MRKVQTRGGVPAPMDQQHAVQLFASLISLPSLLILISLPDSVGKANDDVSVVGTVALVMRCVVSQIFLRFEVLLPNVLVEFAEGKLRIRKNHDSYFEDIY